ncbi:fluoride efflux transporter CrcB [Nocardia harenae]|uniref:fluoride efflux transporter CrcB n=1 Tax=Nocardia harenae TaxID=358707 RepID=UPI0008306BCD|nr:fluoride efflux transporter CrcB [Nocardia harenae]
MTALLVALAGSAGAMTRFAVDAAIKRRWAPNFPVATLVVNATGSLLLGILTGLVLHRHAASQLELVLGAGFCGGYTTFSTASVETVRLVQDRRYRAAFAYAFGGLAVTLLAATAGFALAAPLGRAG